MDVHEESPGYRELINRGITSIDGLYLHMENDQMGASIINHQEDLDISFELGRTVPYHPAFCPPSIDFHEKLATSFFCHLHQVLGQVTSIGLLSVTWSHIAHVRCEHSREADNFHTAYRAQADRFFDVFFKNREIAVKEIRLKNMVLPEIQNILAFVKPRALKAIHLDISLQCHEEHLDLSELFHLETWKLAQKFSTRSTLFDWKDLQHYLHFQNVEVMYYGDFSIRNLEMLREALLRNPNLAQFKINTTLDHYPNQAIIDKLKRLHTSDWVYFSYPNAGKLGQYLSYKMIWFRGPCYKKDGRGLEADSDEDEDWDSEEEDTVINQ